MRTFRNLILLSLGVVLLSSCGVQMITVKPGQGVVLAPDMKIRLWSLRPTLTQLQLQIAVIPTGKTSLSSLVPQVVVIPSGGQETSASLNLSDGQAIINMLLGDAQHVTSVLIKDARSGQSAEWYIPGPEPLFGCQTGDECQLIGMPHTGTVPLRP